MITSDALFHQFALILPPGLEQLGEKEWNEKIQGDYQILSIQSGLIEIKAATEIMLKASLLLKIPTRILLRIDSFKARDFPKLFKKSSKINWGQWYTSVPKEIKVTASKSRLIHTDRIEKSLRDGIEKYFKGNPPKEKHRERSKAFPQSRLHANLRDDQMDLSLDISGTKLYTRGRTFISKAPLRENLAAALCAFADTTSANKILDPMAGGGTLALEALTFNHAVLSKKQAWEAFKIFQGIEKENLVEKQEKEVQNFVVNEKDATVFKALKENLSSLPSVSFHQGDAFDLDIQQDVDLIISNPPWGERVKIVEGKKTFYSKLLEKFKGKKICLILPRDHELPREIINKAKILKLKSGGFPIIYACWEADL
jgi:putative N6-adenine-specific DNA methylase